MKVIFLKIKGYLLHSFILKMDCYVFEEKGGDHCLLFLLLTQNKNPALCSIVSIFLIKECMPSSFRCKLQYRDVDLYYCWKVSLEFTLKTQRSKLSQFSKIWLNLLKYPTFSKVFAIFLDYAKNISIYFQIIIQFTYGIFLLYYFASHFILGYLISNRRRLSL